MASILFQRSLRHAGSWPAELIAWPSWVSCPLVATMSRTFYVHMRSAGGRIFKPRHFPARQKLFVFQKNSKGYVGLNIPKGRWFLEGSCCLANSRPILTRNPQVFFDIISSTVLNGVEEPMHQHPRNLLLLIRQQAEWHAANWSEPAWPCRSCRFDPDGQGTLPTTGWPGWELMMMEAFPNFFGKRPLHFCRIKYDKTKWLAVSRYNKHDHRNWGK